MVAGLIGRQYQCVVTDANGKTATTQPILISEETGSEAPVITEQTEAISAAIGENFTLHVAATGAAPLTYQWQFALAGSSSFKNASSTDAKKADWTISMVAGLIGRQYQCVVTDANGETATSQPILISESIETEPPVITEQTEAISAVIGESFTLHVAATGTEPLTYQWQFAAAGSTSFKNASSVEAKNSDWTISMVKGLIGRQYQCVVTDANGKTATSQPILISENIETEPPVITEQTETIKAKIGESFTLHVAATGTEPLTYQWQFALAGTTEFRNASSVDAKNADWTITLVAGLIGRQYQCVVTDANGKTTTSAPILIEEDTAIIIDGVEYAIIDSQNCYVVSYSGTADSLTIPTTVEGHTVTEIGEEAFMGKSIVSISLPNTITIIHARAFKDCTNLSTMTNHD